MAGYLSYAEQSFHYFSRPHDGPARAAIDSAATGRGADRADSDEWSQALTGAQVEEIERALSHVGATGEDRKTYFPGRPRSSDPGVCSRSGWAVSS
jgi:hypothetical protein